jgi:hypothetical protein
MDQTNGGRPLAAALDYTTTRGWSVFPAPPGTKQSYKSAEYSNGAPWGKTKDPKQIRRDWQKWPDANVGIPTGKDNGIWVVEADTAKGHPKLGLVDGIAELRKLETTYNTLPHTLMAVSPSGSLHYYFKWPTNLPDGMTIINSASKIAPGIDVRAEGGMVIAPPSVKPVGAYRWLNDGIPIADAPDWLIKLATAPETDKRKEAKARTSRRAPASSSSSPPTQQLETLPPWLVSAIADSTGCGVSTDPQDLPPPADPAKIDAALAVVDAGLGHDDWIAVGCGLLKELGEAKGHEVFHQWSKRGHNYDPKTFEQQWDSLVSKDGYGWTIGTLFHLANIADADWWRRLQFDNAVEVVRLDDAVEVLP